jgi:hypothetical protein
LTNPIAIDTVFEIAFAPQERKLNCPSCGATNSEANKFCGDCGAALDAQAFRIEGVVKAQVEKVIQERLKDQNVLDVETSQAIAERLTRWGKIFGGFIALPATILIGILVVSGIESYRDFKARITNIEHQIQPQIDHAKQVADSAQVTAAEAKSIGDEAKNSAEQAKTEATASQKGIEAASTAAQRQIDSASKQVQGSSGKVDSQMWELNEQIDGAKKEIAIQQQKLASTDELVKTLFSKGTTEVFPTNGPELPNIVVASQQVGAIIFVLLKSAPIYQTVELKWRVFSQPRGSYTVDNNLLIFFWGDAGNTISQYPLEITYVPDPTVKTSPFKKLSVKDGALYVDEVKRMDLPPKAK